MEQQFLRDAGGKKLGSCVVGTVPHHFSALPGRQLFSADINFPTALLLQPRQNHGKGSFSRAVSASQGGDLPGGQRKIQIFKNKELFAPAGQIPAEKMFLPAFAGTPGREASVSVTSRRPYRFRSSSESSLICAGVFSHWMVPSET